MPLYEWGCDKCGHKETVMCRVEDRDGWAPEHKHPMRRLIGGTGRMLYFEEGRQRHIQALGDKPIASEGERKRLARINGVVESGDTVPASIAKNPQSIGLKRFLDNQKTRRWF